MSGRHLTYTAVPWAESIYRIPAVAAGIQLICRYQEKLFPRSALINFRGLREVQSIPDPWRSICAILSKREYDPRTRACASDLALTRVENSQQLRCTIKG
jgi:hypothetical protein